jgi:hypothetical protein
MNTKFGNTRKMSKSARFWAVYWELCDNGVPKQMAKSFARRLMENPGLMKEIEAARKAAA